MVHVCVCVHRFLYLTYSVFRFIYLKYVYPDQKKVWKNVDVTINYGFASKPEKFPGLDSQGMAFNYLHCPFR